jgi:hypothetical protein
MTAPFALLHLAEGACEMGRNQAKSAVIVHRQSFDVNGFVDC